MTELKLKQKYITLDSDTRLYGLSIPIIGLTGSIATGKSTVSNHLKKLGFPLIDADELVHKIYKDQSTITLVNSLSPQSIKDEEIHFPTLREAFFKDEFIQQKLENHIYARLPSEFEKAMKLFNAPSFVVYDVPLLFEKKLKPLIDVSVCVYCSEETQIQRLIARDKISQDLAKSILDKQISIEQKRKQSDHIINNNGDLDDISMKIQDVTLLLFE